MKTILVVTSAAERNVERVLNFVPHGLAVRLDTERLLERQFQCTLRDGSIDWRFSGNASAIEASEVGAIWYRRPAFPRAPAEVQPRYHGFVEHETQLFLRYLWSTIDPERVFWMDQPHVLRELDGNKLLQMKVAARVGLAVPETLVTNDADAAEDFFRSCNGEVILKVFGVTGVEDMDGRSVGVYTTRISRDDLKAYRSEIRYAPVLLQRYIPKDVELRITAVGKSLFACAIHSQDSPKTRDDWRRYDFARVRHEAYELPDEVTEKLRALLRELGLQFGAIDMILTPAGEYVFLEINPSGQWGWIETLTGLPISKAIADVLLAGVRHRDE